MTRWSSVARLLAPSVHKSIFGGFAVVLLLLVAFAAETLRGMEAVGEGASRVSQDSNQATASAEIALLVGEARRLVVQYALTATMDDQKAAQAALFRLDASIDRSRTDDSSASRDMRPLVAQYRAAVDAGIAAIETRRSDIEQMQAAATELRTIVSATTEVLDRDADPVLLEAAARLANSFGATDGAAARFIASRTPAEANAAASALQALRSAIDTLGSASAGNRRVQRFVKGMSEPLDRFARSLELVGADDERLRLTAKAREAASIAVLRRLRMNGRVPLGRKAMRSRRCWRASLRRAA